MIKNMKRNSEIKKYGPKRTGFVFLILTLVLIAVFLISFMLGRYPVTAEELAEIFERSLPEPLGSYLLNEQEGRTPICKAWS